MQCAIVKEGKEGEKEGRRAEKKMGHNARILLLLLISTSIENLNRIAWLNGGHDQRTRARTGVVCTGLNKDTLT